LATGRRDVTPKRYRYVTRATATTKCRVGQECSSTQGLYRLCGHPHRNPHGGYRHRHPPTRSFDGRRQTRMRGGPPTARARSTVRHAHARTHPHIGNRENCPTVKSVGIIIIILRRQNELSRRYNNIAYRLWYYAKTWIL